jgi:hypothetical protein
MPFDPAIPNAESTVPSDAPWTEAPRHSLRIRLVDWARRDLPFLAVGLAVASVVITVLFSGSRAVPDGGGQPAPRGGSDHAARRFYPYGSSQERRIYNSLPSETRERLDQAPTGGVVEAGPSGGRWLKGSDGWTRVD